MKASPSRFSVLLVLVVALMMLPGCCQWLAQPDANVLGRWGIGITYDDGAFFVQESVEFSGNQVEYIYYEESGWGTYSYSLSGIYYSSTCPGMIGVSLSTLNFDESGYRAIIENFFNDLTVGEQNYILAEMGSVSAYVEDELGKILSRVQAMNRKMYQGSYTLDATGSLLTLSLGELISAQLCYF